MVVVLGGIRICSCCSKQINCGRRGDRKISCNCVASINWLYCIRDLRTHEHRADSTQREVERKRQNTGTHLFINRSFSFRCKKDFLHNNLRNNNLPTKAACTRVNKNEYKIKEGIPLYRHALCELKGARGTQTKYRQVRLLFGE